MFARECLSLFLLDITTSLKVTAKPNRRKMWIKTGDINQSVTTISHTDWLIDWVVLLRPTWHKIGHFDDVLQANLLAWYAKLNLTQLKHTFTNQKKCTSTQNKYKKNKARFSRLLRHPAWKRRGPILVLVLHKSVTYWLTKTLTHLLTALDPHGVNTYAKWLHITAVCPIKVNNNKNTCQSTVQTPSKYQSI